MALRPIVSVGGQDNPSLSSGLLRLSIVDSLDDGRHCEATFSNWGPIGSAVGYLYFDRQLLDFGKTFQIKLQSVQLFDGRITAITANFPQASPPEITVRADDHFEDLRMTRRTRTFTNASDADIFQQVAADHGLASVVDAPGPVHPVVAQLNQSDLAFLLERARSIDAELWIDGATLHAQSHARRASIALTMARGAALHDFTVTAALAGEATSVTVTGWDVAAKSAIAQEASEPAISVELNGGDSAASILTRSFGARAQVIAGTVPLDAAEAQALAEARFRTGARRFITGRGLAETTPLLRVGGRVDLQGLGPLFSGGYYVTEVHHLFDASAGLRTEFAAERPGLGR